MNILDTGGYNLRTLGEINILLGKNGCGKSRLLRAIEPVLKQQTDEWGHVQYITPERGGGLTYQGGIEQHLTNNPSAWLANQRRKNQTQAFKQQSVAQFRRLETLVLREMESDVEKGTDEPVTFKSYIDKINALLDNIEIQRSGLYFDIFAREDDQEINAEQVSSGEGELIALSIEFLMFAQECEISKKNLLLLDSPDVHLHPDLQNRLMDFLRKLADSNNFAVLLATHSTAILGALHDYGEARIAFMKPNQKGLDFKRVSDVHRRILPIFGAHPLSNVFNQTPPLLVDGEDDVRIWQQAVRTARGAIKVYPCSCDGAGGFAQFEKEIVDLISSIYDKAKAYSLRDGDGITDPINNTPPLNRFRLQCRNAENLLLADEVLSHLSTNWDALQEKIDRWLEVEENKNHSRYDILAGFKSGGYDRKNHNIKEARYTIMDFIGSSKPWEVAIGQTIGKLEWDETTDFNQENSIFQYLGEEFVVEILPKRA